MIREPLPLDQADLVACLISHYGLATPQMTFLPIGYDPNAAVYRVATTDGGDYFLKLSRNQPVPASLQIPRALLDQGVAHVVGPLRTQEGELWCRLGPYSVVLYPYIDGENAMVQGMTAEQWQTFGVALNALHHSGLQIHFADTLPREDFATPAIATVRSQLAQASSGIFEQPVQQELVAFLQQKAEQIGQMVDRAEELGTLLRARSWEYVLCHGDIHGANIMLERTGKLYLVDWDTPRIAPRERDLIFIIRSVIARRVAAEEEAAFFIGYGPYQADANALSYYRYERILEDIAICAEGIFFNETASLAVKESDLRLLKGLFSPGDIVEGTLSNDHRH
jgi:spectinomycin phosphotransferase